MTDYLPLIVGCLMLGATITYALWTRMRIWFFRQDLFTIRNDLWDNMRAKGVLDNVDHRQLRRCINSLIRSAPHLSISTVAFIVLASKESRRVISPNAPAEVQHAWDTMSQRIRRYVVFHSLFGLFALAVAEVAMASTLPSRKIMQWIGSFASSREVAEYTLAEDKIMSLRP